MKRLYKILPWLFVALFGAEIVAVYMPKRQEGWQTQEFGRLPVLMNGRVQPIDTVGRNALLQIRSTGEVPLEQVPRWQFWKHPKKLKPADWLLEVFFKPELADTRPIFVIHHYDILAELKIEDKGIERSGLRYYTFEQLRSALPEVEERANEARQIDDKQRNAFQKQIVQLHYALFVYQSLKAAVRPPSWSNFQEQLAAFESNMEAGVKALDARREGKEFDQEAAARFWEPLMGVLTLAKDPNAGQIFPLVVPPTEKEQKREDWSTLAQSVMGAIQTKRIPEPVRAYAAIGTAYSQTNQAGFNSAVASYKTWLASNGFQKEVAKGRNEFFFSNTKSFLHAIIIYVMAFLLGTGALLTISAAPALGESLRKSAFYLVILAFAVHTFGLGLRMYLEARPPVTNLYSSAIFIGWGSVLLGILLERFYKLGLGSAAGALTGFVTLIIAHNLALGGDTMEMMRAVLDSNFWLTTHVITITIGYSANFVAGLLGVAFILLGVFTRLLRTPAGNMALGQALSRMIYAIICFATLFSFVGTVLGGIWADQSWGRFWGWDPKENGALLIVLWNAVILHARWGGLARDRGTANMAVFGNIITSFSWFGVNMLGIGLHSYGFMDAAFQWLSIFMGSQALIIALGLVPLSAWKSFRKSEGPTPLPAGDSSAGLPEKA